MCKSSMHSLLRQLPKCEHHLHLEGALTPQLLFELAKKNSVLLPPDDHAFTTADTLRERYNNFTSLDDFLGYYYIGMSVLQTAADFEALATDYFNHAHADGVVHAEVFFDPQAHLSRGVTYDTVLSGFTAARERAKIDLDISSELICCFLRHLPVPKSMAVFRSEEVQRSFRDGTVLAIGLDSSELGFEPSLFRELYAEAKALGLRRTAHAGEEGPASFVRDAMDVLDVERIDHGIRLADDAELLKRIAGKGLLLTVCPVSNVLLRCVSSVGELPIRKFFDAGVQFSINSDDPSYFGGHHILDNYCAVQEAFNLTVGEWRRVCEASITGSWCDDARKANLLTRLESILQERQAEEDRSLRDSAKQEQMF